VFSAGVEDMNGKLFFEFFGAQRKWFVEAVQAE